MRREVSGESYRKKIDTHIYASLMGNIYLQIALSKEAEASASPSALKRAEYTAALCPDNSMVGACKDDVLVSPGCDGLKRERGQTGQGVEVWGYNGNG